MNTILATISSKGRAMTAVLQMHLLIILMSIPSASRVVSTQPRLVHPVNMLIAKELGWKPRPDHK